MIFDIRWETATISLAFGAIYSVASSLIHERRRKQHNDGSATDIEKEK